MGGDRAIGGHTPANRHSFIAGARSADNFHAQAPLGRALGCSVEGEEPQAESHDPDEASKINASPRVEGVFDHTMAWELDSLGVGYEIFPEDVRTRVVSQFPRVNFKQEIAQAFFHGFEHKPETIEYTCNEDICSHFIRNHRRRNFYDQVQNAPFQNSV
jgi:hypothetical protein